MLRLVERIHVFPYHNETNRNGEMLLELSQEKNLVICNTFFQKSEKRLWTYISAKGEKSQLHYILIRIKNGGTT